MTELSAGGVTVVITTHDMEEAAKLCDRVGIVDHGKLLALDSPTALTESLPGTGTLTVTLRTPGSAAATLGSAELNDVIRALEKTTGVERVEAVGPAMPGSTPAAEGSEAAATSGAGNPGTNRLRIYTTGRPTTALPAVVGVFAELHCDLDDVSSAS